MWSAGHDNGRRPVPFKTLPYRFATGRRIMLRSLCRIDLSDGGRDFQRVALQPGFPLLDKAYANAKVLQKWLGRLAAEPKWDGDAVLFYARNDDGILLESVKAWPARSADLHGALAPELEAIRQKLNQVKPRVPKEIVLHRAITRQLQDDIARSEIDDPAGSFFKYKDELGKKRLSWCWGYRRKDTEPAAAAVCPATPCRQSAMLRAGALPTCVRCGTRIAGWSMGQKSAVAAVLILLLVAIGLLGTASYLSVSPAEIVSGAAFRDDKTDQSVPESAPQASQAVSDVDVKESMSQPDAAQQTPAEPVMEQATTATLVGHVLDAVSESALSGASVTIAGTSHSAKTDDEGRFRIEEVPIGRIEIDVVASGYATQHLTQNVRPNREQTVRVTLKGIALLAGEVIDATSRKPVPDAKVTITGSTLTATTDSGGRFRIEGLPGGPAKIEVAATGYGTQHIDQDLTASQEKPLRVELVGAAVLTGQVVDAASERPLSKAEIAIKGMPEKAVTDDDGRFRIEKLRSGPVEISVVAAGHAARQLQQELKPGEETTIEVKLEGGAVLLGQVVDKKSQEPVSGATVAIAGTALKTETDDEGRFRFESVRAGVVAIDVAATGYAAQQLKQELKPAEETSIQFALVGGAALVGQVVDSANDMPIANAQVTVSGGPEPVETTDDGRFRFENIRVAAAEINVSASGYAAVRLEQQLKAAEETSIRVKLMKTASPPEPKTTDRDNAGPLVDFFGIKSKAATVGFVVDCSGSMSGQRIRRTKLELAESLFELMPGQRFYVSFFSDDALPMSEEPRSPVEASPLQKVRAYNWMKTIDADGGTQPESSLQLIARMKPDVIFLLSDGEFGALSAETSRLFEDNKIKVNTLAFEDESGKQRLQEIAQKTGGTYRFVPSAELPPDAELMLDTRLAVLLIDALDDPAPSNPQDVRKALVELCDNQDFGPSENASASGIRQSMGKWTEWWVKNRLVPSYKDFGPERLQAEMQSPQFLRRWGALMAARQRNLDIPDAYIAALRDSEERIRQAARLALVELSGGEDYGPAEGASELDRVKSIARWKEWRTQQGMIDGLQTADVGALVSRFRHADANMRKAALAEARKRKLDKWDDFISALGDSSPDVCQEAHGALVELAKGGVDFGPGPEASEADRAAAAGRWKTWRAEQIEMQKQQKMQIIEKQAQKKLTLANQMLKRFRKIAEADASTNGRIDAKSQGLLKRRYEEIIKEFPGTKAAETARTNLNTLK